MKKNKRYLTIYEQVREDIITKRYHKGAKLPSKRVMAERMGVSIITVEHAYELLLEEGYIASKEKSGYFVIFDDKDIYSASPSHKEDHITKVPVSSPPSEPSPYPGKRAIDNLDFSYSIYAKTVRRILSDYGPMVTEKSPFQGLYDLRRAISEYLGRSRHIQVSPQQIIIGAGAEYLYGLIVETFGRDISYGIESPSYQKIAKVYEAGGARLEMMRLVSDGIDSRDLWSGNMKVLHITPYRSFPSGVTASASKKREYLKWSQQNDGFIVEDDFESEFTTSRKAEETLFSIDQNDRVIYVNTFTRTIGSFVRCAYMVLPERLLGLFEKKSGFRECPVPTLDQLVLAALINGGDFERHINRVRRHNRRS
ncbi:MAG: PLP-dependent aminotransferase family protein [Butyrivibrio sp.]|uniref:MocR-like pyridoxine biosynthesis transcription factor PdxR n=1 Tax=Butyrivibrio sp. TaxID=28121 RepID=UPI001B65D840|nr:PLP-dependent aminotransferase family protein [Butyrivibrio sp.]MBP3782160.1 PLP-dependent aminotransferase family protein [Butyrivibrio sp.]